MRTVESVGAAAGEGVRRPGLHVAERLLKVHVYLIEILIKMIHDSDL